MAKSAAITSTVAVTVWRICPLVAVIVIVVVALGALATTLTGKVVLLPATIVLFVRLPCTLPSEELELTVKLMG